MFLESSSTSKRMIGIHPSLKTSMLKKCARRDNLYRLQTTLDRSQLRTDHCGGSPVYAYSPLHTGVLLLRAMRRCISVIPLPYRYTPGAAFPRKSLRTPHRHSQKLQIITGYYRQTAIHYQQLAGIQIAYHYKVWSRLPGIYQCELGAFNADHRQ